MNGVAVAMILVHQEKWVAPAVVLISICAAMVAVQQYEDRLLRTNNAIVTLDTILCDWNTLDDGDQIKRSNAFKCVSSIEEVIAAQAVGALTRSSDKDDEQKESGDGGADSKEKKKNA